MRKQLMRPRALAVAALVATLLISMIGTATAAPAGGSEAATWEEVWFPSADGTQLHADVFLPNDRAVKERHPVILSVGPYFGSGGSGPTDVTPTHEGPILRFKDLMEQGRIFERGYAYVQVDLRGTGGSEGCYDLGGPGEQMDVKAAVEWAASQPWSTGKVGMWGKSYDAWTQVMALATGPKGLAATVIQAPLAELYRGLFMNGVHYYARWYAVPAEYGVGDLKPPSLADSSPEEILHASDGFKHPDCYAKNIAMTADPDPSGTYWQERMLVDRAARSKVPVLWTHGLLESNAMPDNFADLFPRLRGPKRAWVGQFHHVRGNESELVGREGFMQEAMNWLDHHLKGKPLRDLPNIEVQDNEGNWRSEKSWPPVDASKYAMPVIPAAYQDVRGNDAWDPALGTWTFTQPAPYDLHIAGEPRLSLDLDSIAPSVNVIALVYDVFPNGRAKLISRGASTASDQVSFDLYPQDWRLRRGHRLGLQISGSDEWWFSPLSSGTTVEITEGKLEIPFLRYVRTNDLEGGRAAAMRWVPVVSLADDLIGAHTTTMHFPPPMERSDRRPR